MILEGFYGTQKASPLLLIHGRPCISVTCWSCQCMACPHVSAHVTVRRHMRPKERGRGNAAALPFDCVQCSKWVQPNPVGVSMYSREQRWGGTAASVTCPHP